MLSASLKHFSFFFFHVLNKVNKINLNNFSTWYERIVTPRDIVREGVGGWGRVGLCFVVTRTN